MGDDEFFSGFDAPARANAPRNPLTLDEITSLSRKLLNIAFTLFWREGQIGAQNGRIPGLNVTWESVRRKVTRFLQAVHTREYALPSSHRHPLICGFAVRDGRSHHPTTGWLTNILISELLSKPPCERLCCLIRCLLIIPKESRSSNLCSQPGHDPT